MNIYVGNLPFKATDDEIRDLFAEFGEVDSVNLVKDRYSGQSKGFGFVEMSSQSDAEQAIERLNGSSMHVRQLRVNEARPRNNDR